MLAMQLKSTLNMVFFGCPTFSLLLLHVQDPKSLDILPLNNGHCYACAYLVLKASL